MDPTTALVAGAIVATLAAGGLRWLSVSIRRSIEDICDTRLSPKLADLEVSVNKLRLENAEDHAVTNMRLERLEERVHDLERVIMGPGDG